MTRPDDPQFSVVFDRFEQAWQRGFGPEIDDFLPARLEALFRSRREILIELILIDLERRWRAARPDDEGASDAPRGGQGRMPLPRRPHLEDYVARYPDLGVLSDLPLNLICHEYRVRHRWGDQPMRDQYTSRFLDQTGKLATELARIDDELGREKPPTEAADAVRGKPHDDRLSPTIVQAVASGSKSGFIGPYKILQAIAEGGMGSVFMAEQEKPVRRRVALKIIKADVPSKEVLARFEAERQALAMMDHQNIAKVLDAGVTDEGQPYFAMELVKGVPITKYCDQNRLNPNERLELFVQVCRAIQHAHQKGIIHRDIKPSNVLVTLYDGKPVAKVIDFGLAKALQTQMKLTERTMFTQFGQVVGTLEYMSPEQAEMNTLDVDTRTDVYSLGVMLYELLTGSTPIGRERLKSQAFDRILQLIREEEVQRPSTRLSESGDAITGISQQRKTDPRKLSLLLKGDLDWIAVKALEKDRTRRYDGASALADDVERFLQDEPIQARPPSMGYQIRKSLRKHKAAFTTAAAVFFLLLAGLAGTGSMWWRAAKAETTAMEEATNARNALAIAEKAKADALQEKTAADIARTESQKAQAAAELERDRAREAETKAEKSSVIAMQQSQLVLKTLEGILKETASYEYFGDEAEKERGRTARRELVRSALAGLTDVAEQFVARAEADPTALKSVDDFGELLLRIAPSFDEAEFDVATRTAAQLFTTSLSVRQRLAESDPIHQQTRDLLVRAHERLADVAMATKSQATSEQVDAAEKHLRNALNIRSQSVATDPGNTETQLMLIRCHDKLAGFLQNSGRNEAAVREYQAAFTLCEALTQTARDDAAKRVHLIARCESVGGILKQIGQTEESLRHYRLALVIREQSPTPDTTAVIQATERLADLLRDTSKLDEAVPYYRRALELRRTLASAATQELTGLIEAQNKLGNLFVDAKKVDDGLSEFRQALETSREFRERDPKNTAIQLLFIQCCDQLGETLHRQSNAEAIDCFLVGSRAQEALLRSHPDNTDLRQTLASRLQNVRSTIGWSIAKDTGEKVLECLQIELRILRKLPVPQLSASSAEQQLDDAFDAILHTADSGDQYDRPEQFNLLMKFFADELADYQRRAMENPEDPQIQYGLARQNRLLGELFFPGWDLDAEAAVPFFEAEQAVLEKLSVADDPLSQRRMAESHEHLADALRAVHNLPAALEECQAALSIRKLLATAALSSENEDPTHTLKLLALAHGRVAGAAVAVDNKLEAQQHARLAVDIWEEWKGKFMAIHPTSDPLEYEGRSMIGAYMQAGRIFWDAGETTEARQFFKSMIQLFNSRLAISNNIADFDLLNEYCEAVEKAGILDDVRQQFTKLVELAERRAANQELDVYQREELARPYKAFGDFEFRQMEFDHAIALYEKGVTYAGPDGGGSYGCRAADFYASLAKTHVAKGDDLSDFVKSFNSKRPEGLYTRSELACTLAKDGHWEAVAELIHDWESFDDPQGWGPLQLASCCVTLFCMQEDAASAGSKNDAAPDTHYLERAIAGFRKALATAENAEKDPQLRDSYLHWIVNQRDLAHSPRSCALSEPLIRDCVAAFEKQHPGAIIGNPRSLLATVLLGQQKYAEAERLLLDTFRALLAAQISNLDQQLDRETGLCATLKDLIRLYSETGKLDEVAKWRIESEKLYLKRMHEKIWLSYYPGREWYVQNLVDLYTSWNKPAEAAKWQKRR